MFILDCRSKVELNPLKTKTIAMQAIIKLLFTWTLVITETLTPSSTSSFSCDNSWSSVILETTQTLTAVWKTHLDWSVRVFAGFCDSAPFLLLSTNFTVCKAYCCVVGYLGTIAAIQCGHHNRIMWQNVHHKKEMVERSSIVKHFFFRQLLNKTHNRFVG